MKFGNLSKKKLMVLRYKSKLKSKFILEGSKTMKRSKNRRGLTQVKAIFFAYKQTSNIDIL